jgi:hypothetical protein
MHPENFSVEILKCRKKVEFTKSPHLLSGGSIPPRIHESELSFFPPRLRIGTCASRLATSSTTQGEGIHSSLRFALRRVDLLVLEFSLGSQFLYIDHAQ